MTFGLTDVELNVLSRYHYLFACGCLSEIFCIFSVHFGAILWALGRRFASWRIGFHYRLLPMHTSGRSFLTRVHQDARRWSWNWLRQAALVVLVKISQVRFIFLTLTVIGRIITPAISAMTGSLRQTCRVSTSIFAFIHVDTLFRTDAERLLI